MVEGARLEIVWAGDRLGGSNPLASAKKEIIMSTVFAKIIAGKLPCYKIYEDDKTLAFLDINPEVPGHTLVIPKVGYDKVYELPDDDYLALMKTVKKLALHFEKITGKRIIMKVIGTDVPHAHVHLMPLDPHWYSNPQTPLTDQEMAELAQKLAL